MKVPDVKREHSMADEVNDMALYRKKKKRAKRIRNLIILAVVIVAVALLWVYRDVIFEPLRGIASKIDNTTTTSVGYPVKLEASSDYELLPMGDSFVLVTDTYMYTYASNGGQRYALQHGYVTPTSVSNNKRVLIYDKGGHDFSLYNKNARIYQQSIKDEIIVSGFLSDNENVAIVTSSGSYSNIIYIYDGNGEWLYTQKFVDSLVMQAAFSPDNKEIYLALAHSEDGSIKTEIKKIRPGKENSELWSYEIDDCLSVDICFTDDVLTVYGDDRITTISKDGKLLGSYGYTGALEKISSTPGERIVVTDNSTKNSTITLFNEKCEVTATVVSEEKVKRIYKCDNGYLMLMDRQLALYDQSLNIIKQTTLDDEYSRLNRDRKPLSPLAYPERIVRGAEHAI